MVVHLLTMGRPIIQVDNLSKRYRLGVVSSKTLRDAVNHFWRTRIRKKAAFGVSSGASDFWALRDLSFAVARGEVLGIIGRNGAGKSTLLKILSRITEPTSGEVHLRGRVSSLLEVGTGFHPDLSGRENIYLNGAILGMRRALINRRFDEIVEFADVAEFLDTPVKHYSSGMYVRLAFAVAAHLEPDILIVDEVLAVGDQKFQEKCIGKMRAIAAAYDRTVLFVSHSMANVRQLCSSAILLNRGQLALQGSTEDVIGAYSKSSHTDAKLVTVSGNGVELERARLLDSHSGAATDSPVFNRSYVIELVFEARSPIREAMVVAEVEDTFGSVVSTLGTVEEGLNPFLLSGLVKVRFQIESLILTPARFRVRVSIYRWLENAPMLEVQNALSFEVQPAPIGSAIASYQRAFGIVRIVRGVTVEQGSAASR